MKKLLLTLNVYVLFQSQISYNVSAASTLCSESDTEEAERAFKNCVESSQSSLVTSSNQGNLDQNGLCAELDRMFSLCKDQKQQLALCKGQEHAANIQNIHVSVTANIIRSINRNISLDECHLQSNVLENGDPNEEEAWKSDERSNNSNSYEGQDGDDAPPPAAEPWPSESRPKTVTESSAASFGTSTFLFLFVVLAKMQIGIVFSN